MKIIFSLCLFLFSLNNAQATIRFLTITDIHYGAKNTSQEGQDTGPEFLKIALNKFQKLSKDVNFILFLGDIPTHSLTPDPQKANYEKIVFHGLYKNNPYAKPMFYITGNNDSLAGNYQAFTSNGVTPLSYAPDWQGACAHCQGLIIDGSHMDQYGYYSSYLMPHNKELMLIVLNANQFARIPSLKRIFFAPYPNQKDDAFMQLKWFKQQLKTHRAKQLLIALHEPPGLSYNGEAIWYPAYVHQFIKLLKQYHHLYGQITILSGHTHKEEIRKIHLGKGENIYIYSTPSISRAHHNYPGMKIFTLNQELEINNFTTYYTSHLHQWTHQHYHALNSPGAIFPDCKKKTLSSCLDNLSRDEYCNALSHGFFYGVKNPAVNNNSCRATYYINPD